MSEKAEREYENGRRFLVATEDFDMSNGRPWGAEDSATLMRLHATHHDHEIAERTGHTRETVCRRRVALGLPAYYGTRYADWPALPAMSQKAIRRACAA